MKIETQKISENLIDINTDFEIQDATKILIQAVPGVETLLRFRYRMQLVTGKCFDIDSVEKDCLRIMEAAGAES